MKTIKWTYLLVAASVLVACSKESNSITNTVNLYVPSGSDTTVNTTLVELQQGRELYINNCGVCHSLYVPESYTVPQWKSMLSVMAPRTNMSSVQITLVTKYVCKGKQ